MGRAIAGRGVVELLRVLLGEVDQLGDGLGLRPCRDATTMHLRRLGDDRDRDEIGLDVVVELRIERRRDRMMSRTDEEGVAVRAGLGRAAEAPTVPPAPPRFSITMRWLSCWSSWAASGRAKASVPPPAGNGTMKVIGRCGQLCAWAGACNASTRRQPSPRRSRYRLVIIGSVLPSAELLALTVASGLGSAGVMGGIRALARMIWRSWCSATEGQG